MIERGEAAKYAKYKFYEDFNDVDIFVEDTAREARKVYVELLSRIFNHKLSIVQVFPVGPKSAVIKRCRNDQGARPRRALYIVDGDYEILTGVAIPDLKRLYRLKRYCVENYLLDPDAVVDVLSDESLEVDEAAIRAGLDYAQWATRVAQPLTDLVVALAAASIKQCGLPTVKLDLAKIQGRYWDHVDAGKVVQLVDEYKKKIDERYGGGVGDAVLKSLRDKVEPHSEGAFLKYISAKALLLPLLISRVKRKLGIEVDYPKLRVKLARRCDISEITDLRGYIG